MSNRYETLANSIPVNKQAGIVTSQIGCDDNILIVEDRERLEVLGSQKRYYADEVTKLKQELKIKPNWNKKVLPRFILDNPKYPEFMQLRCKLSELDIEINELHKKIKKQQPNDRFEQNFVDIVRKRYPHIFEEVKAFIKELEANATR